MPFARHASIVDCDLLSACAAASSPRIASSPRATRPASFPTISAAISGASAAASVEASIETPLVFGPSCLIRLTGPRYAQLTPSSRTSQAYRHDKYVMLALGQHMYHHGAAL